MRHSLARMLALAATLLITHTAAASDEKPTAYPFRTPVADDTKWLLLLPQDKHITYHGVASFDNAGVGNSSVLYQAPNVGGFLAEVIAHGLIAESAKKKQKDELQESADHVLSPYKDILEDFKYTDLMQRAVGKTTTGKNDGFIETINDPAHEIVVESMPSFSMTQDQAAIILDNTIIIHAPNSASGISYQNTVRVISTPEDASNLSAFWTANNGEKLKEENALLVAKSIDIAFRDAVADDHTKDIPFRTIRYRQGLAEKFERAQVLNEQCNRLLIKTLRGTLMSVPASRSGFTTPAGNNCEAGVITSQNTQ